MSLTIVNFRRFDALKLNVISHIWYYSKRSLHILIRLQTGARSNLCCYKGNECGLKEEDDLDEEHAEENLIHYIPLILKRSFDTFLKKSLTRADVQDIGDESGLEQIKTLLKKKYACYVLVTCSSPKKNGEMSVEMHFDGDEDLAGLLVQQTAQVFESKQQPQERRKG